MTQRICHSLHDQRCLLRRHAHEESNALDDDVCALCQANLADLDSAAAVAGGRLRDAFANSKEREQALHSGLPLNGSSVVSDSSIEDQPPVIAGYEIDGVIGRGGMGVVYRGTQLDLDRVVAIKVLVQSHTVHHRLFAARFYREAQVTAQLDHPSIVPVYAIGEDQLGRRYYTMRLVRGRRLDDILELSRLAKDGWNLSRAVAVMVRICQTIAFAHAHHVIHRDLKPSNVMVGELGEVYVLDWGLARVMHEDAADCIRTADPADLADDSPASNAPLLTFDGTVIGTPAYMPPEQAAGSDQVDHLADIYSLGAILYQLLSGDAPYSNVEHKGSSRERLKAVLAGPPVSVSERSSAATVELAAICDKAMSRRRGDRYGSALELAEELQAYLDGHVVKAHQSGPWAETRKWLRRNRGLAITGASALMMALIGLVATALMQSRAAHDLFLANEDIRKSNRELVAANAREQLAKQRESEAAAAAKRSAELQREAKQEALAQLADSYANFGQQEATAKRYGPAALWFTKAASLLTDPARVALHRMQAAQFGRLAMQPITAWWDRDQLKTLRHLEPNVCARFDLDSTGQFVLICTPPVTKLIDMSRSPPALWGDRVWSAGALSKQGGLAALAAPDGEVQIVRLLDHSIVQRISPTEFSESAAVSSAEVSSRVADPGKVGPVQLLEFSADGQRLIVAAESARIWDLSQSRFLAGQYELPEPVFDAMFREDGLQFVTATRSEKHYVYDVTDVEGNHAPAETISSYLEAERRYAFSVKRRLNSQLPDGQMVDVNIPFVLRTADGKIRCELPHSYARGVDFDELASRLAFLSDVELVTLFDATPVRRHWYIPTDGLSRPRFNHASSLVFAVGHPYCAADSSQAIALRTTRLYDLTSRQPVGKPITPQAPILDGQLSPNDETLVLACAVEGRSINTMFASEGRGGNLQFWDWRSGQRMGEIVSMPSEPRAVQWHPHRPIVAVVCAAGEVLTVDVELRQVNLLYESLTKNDAGRIFEDDYSAGGIKFDPSGQTIVAFGMQGKSVVIDLASGQTRFELSDNVWTSDVAFWRDLVLHSRTGRPPEFRKLATGELVNLGFPAPREGYLGRLSGDHWFLFGYGTTAAIGNLADGQQPTVTLNLGVTGRRGADFIPGTPYVIVGGNWDNQPCAMTIWDRVTGRLVAPAIELSSSQRALGLRVAGDGRHAAMYCDAYGLVIYDLESLHSDSWREHTSDELELWAEVLSSSTIRQGQLVELSLEEWIAKWETFCERCPLLHHRETPLVEAIQDHESHATELEAARLSVESQFHRNVAAQLRKRAAE